MNPATDIAGRQPRILIVDDERHNRQLLEIMLTPEGFHLLTAASGEEALAMVAEQPPDLILLDIMMPGLDGFQVAELLKSDDTTRHIPLILVTALDDHDARLRGLSAGAEEFLSKPVDRAELCVRVRNLSRLKAHGDYYDEYSRLLESEAVTRSADLAEQTERAAALEQVRQDQLRFKDEFLSHVSHELRSPLTAIKQFTTILLGGLAGELNPEQREYQKIVLKNIGQLQAMIDDLLEVTRLETGKLTVELERVSVEDAVTDTFNTLAGAARAKGVSLSSDLAADLPCAHADPTRLRQILIILLDNAIKFTPQGGSAQVRVGLWQEDPRFLLLEVSDTGCGIGPEITERIFERLYQEAGPLRTSRKGLGLGLYICKELVTRQGGRIWAERREEGTTFSLTLPAFSLDDSIGPLLKHDQWPAESAALVVVEACLPAVWPSREAQEEWAHDARSLLHRCLLPDLDVLLPEMRSGAQGEQFFIVAFANDNGASVLANRIRGQFERLLRGKHTGMIVSVSYSLLPPVPREAGASTDAIVTTMVNSVEASIHTYLQPAAAS